MIWKCIADNKAQFKKIDMGKRPLKVMAFTENREDNLTRVQKERQSNKEWKDHKNSQEQLKE